MSQSSARSALFLQEMGVGVQWKLRQGLQDEGAMDGEPVAQAVVAPEQPVAAPVVPAPALAPAPAAIQPEAVSAATPDVPVPAAAAQASAPVAAVSAPARAPAPPPAALDDESTAWFDDAPAPPPAAPSAPRQGPAARPPAPAPARPSPQGGQGPASRPSSRPAAPVDLAPLEDESTAWFDDAPMPPPTAAPARAEPVSDEAIAQMDWDALRAAVSGCTRCTLCETRRAAVNGRGAERASWIAIATAPSQQDEEAGEPVTAEAGQLLNNMLKAIELKPDSEVYVATLVKCRPVDRSPSADEVIACRPFLERELTLTGATMAMTFGQFAAKGLMMGPAARGKVMYYGANQLPVVATYHPDDLLRKPEDKAKAWADLCLAKASHA